MSSKLAKFPTLPMRLAYETSAADTDTVQQAINKHPIVEKGGVQITENAGVVTVTLVPDAIFDPQRIHALMSGLDLGLVKSSAN